MSVPCFLSYTVVHRLLRLLAMPRSIETYPFVRPSILPSASILENIERGIVLSLSLSKLRGFLALPAINRPPTREATAILEAVLESGDGWI